MSPLLAALLITVAAPAPPDATFRPPGTARTEPVPPDDEEVIQNLELLERLELLRHLELFDERGETEPVPPRPPPQPPPKGG
jgi:hypothetical protein